MTNQEAISVLESINAKTDYFLINDDARAVAIDMAISALQAQDLQPTCNNLATDTISRQAAIDEIESYPHGCTWNVESMKDMTDRIKVLPSAQPEIKPIDYQDCANAMLRMWMDEVITDGEYNRIMNKLNAFWRAKHE